WGGTPGAAPRGVGCTPARVSGGGARQFAACPAGLPGLAGEVRGGGQIHLDDGVDVPVLPGGGVLRRAGGAGQVAQARALVAEHDEMLLRAVGMSVIGVLHGDSPSRPAQCRPDALMPAGMPGRAICAGGDLSAGADDRRAASAGADEPVARTARSAPREAVRSTGWRR